MAEETHQRFAWTLSPGLQRAGVVTISGVALFSILLYTRVLSILPGYPAVLVAFFVWAVAPGWLLQQAIFRTRTTGIVERLVVAFLLSMALAAVPGVLALRFHWSLHTFAILYAVVASVASGLSLLWLSERRDAADAEEPREEARSVFTSAPLLLLIGVPLLAIVTSPLWSGERIARSYDNSVYLGYVNGYASTDTLDASKPFLGGSQGAYRRMEVNVWVVVQALLADNAGVEPLDLLMEYLPPLLIVFAVVAMFTLAKGLFRSTSVALLASLFVLAYASLDLSPHEGYGRNVFLRISEDKMVASFILLPVGLLFVSRFLSQPSVSAYLASVLAMVALLVVHPMAVVFLGIALVSLMAVRALTERSLAGGRIGALLLLPWAVVAAGFFLLSWLGDSRIAPINSSFRTEFHFVDLGDGLIMGSYHLFLHPLLLAAILLALPVWLVSRRDIGNQVMVATVLGVLLVVFVPLLTTPVVNALTESAVWRLHWLIPVPLILAYALNHVANRLLSGRHVVRLARRSLPIPKGLVPTAAVLLVLGGAFFVQEQYAMADDGAYYDRTSSTALLPWTGGSIFLGGFERAFSRGWRPTPAKRDLLEYIRANVPPGSTVLVPRSISRLFPGMLSDIRFVDYSGSPDRPERRAVVAKFYNGALWGPELTDILGAYDVDYVVVTSRSRAEDSLRSFAAFAARDFEPRLGAPEIVKGGSRSVHWAWAFDAVERERVAGQHFTIPDDIDPEDPTLEFDIVLAPSHPVVGDEAAQVLLSYTKQGVGGTDGALQTTNAFKEIGLPDGTRAGEVIVRRISPITPVAAGETYSLRVSRVADAPIDTYPDDLWFVGLRVKYWPDSLEEVEGTGYRLYEVSR